MAKGGILLDYNISGVNYALLTQKIRTIWQGGMTDDAREYYVLVLKIISQIDKSGLQDRLIIEDALGCTHHFEAFLYQTLAVLSHIEAINRIREGDISPSYPVMIITEEENKDNLFPPLLIGVLAKNIEFDFTLLLLMATALLERISVFASKFILGKECNFYNLRDRLRHSDDVRASSIVASIDVILPLIGNILITDTEKSLRNRLAHLSSVPELLNSILTIHLLPESRILVFDHDIAGYPLFATAHSINKAVPFIVLSIISILISHDPDQNIIPGTAPVRDPPLSLFEPEWMNPGINRRNYENISGPQIMTTFLKPALTLTETRLENVELHVSVLDAIR